MIPLSLAITLGMIGLLFGLVIGACIRPRRARPSSSAYFLPRPDVDPIARWDADAVRAARMR